jgi:ACS family hexuronate transporter-like MFS transporter
LGIGESAGIPSTGKASHRYLRPAERSWGPALSNTGLNLGILVAAFLIPWLAENYGWRSAFIVPGALGFLWIPLWLWVSSNSNVPEGDPATVTSPLTHRDLLKDPQLWGFAAANFFTMAIYAFWTNWTVLYFDQTFGLKLAEANRWAAIPPLVAYAGGLFGAWLAQVFISSRGLKPMDARFRVCVLMALGALITALVPLGQTPLQATVGIAASLFFSQALGVNFYTLPVDAYGQSRAGFAVAMLTAAFGLLQVLISPNIGRVADQLGSFAPVCVAVAFCPLLGCAILRLTRREESA